jgi:enamine deaminase RidA (YjgF/YER057c/UK114 family)
MADITRRDLLKVSVGAALARGTLSFPMANAADLAGQSVKGESIMSIERYGITEPAGDIPIISLATVHDGIVYLCGVTADRAHLGDIKDQTRQVLERIDKLLGWAGTNKSRLLTAQVWLTDMSHFAAHNAVWNAWVDPKNPPVRACVQSPQLWRPGMLVEIMVSAAKSG